ncbi:hypothetical protein [Pseudarthrobacter chlorophenolicus]|uniref:hypothetical protein n=1 Tax=Pseudarthrobacter chlorophenolicus TaxID=85085 RepID=UPI0012699657|nr:hypothetical protein [Pseudarthrobacter chlorophenolicus]
MLPQSPGRRTRTALREEALTQAPGRPVMMLRPAPVKVRAAFGSAIAYTVTHILVEMDVNGPYSVRWEPGWLVHRL